jgi:hypothetical protein
MNDEHQRVAAWLHTLIDRLFDRVVIATGSRISEGRVMCAGPVPYRRLDCQGRTLAYVRARPRKRAVRIDVTGLWKPPRRSRLVVPAAGGVATLLIRSEGDLDDAVRFLERTVERTLSRTT